MKKIITILSILILTGCASISHPFSYYECSNAESILNSKIEKMNTAYNNLLNTINSSVTIQDKSSYISYNKNLFDSVQIKINTSKSLFDNGDYTFCASTVKTTGDYIDSITLGFNKTNETIKNISDTTNSLSNSVNCSKEKCVIEINDDFINNLSKALNGAGLF